MATESICGVWISPTGEAHLSIGEGKNKREEVVEKWTPFLWADSLPIGGKVSEERLNGDDPFKHLLSFEMMEDLRDATQKSQRNFAMEMVRPYECQFLLYCQKRLYAELSFNDLHRCQCDIETACSVEGSFSDAKRKEDRVLAIGLHFNDERKSHLLTLENMSDEAERELLQSFNSILLEEDPDVIEGHNIHSFDFQYLRQRGKRLKVPCAWGRFGKEANFRNSRLRVAERWVDFARCDIPGRAIFDSYLAIQLFDLTTRDLISYGLKDVAIYLGITGGDRSSRTYIAGDKIQHAFSEDRDTFLAYLADDLRETKGVADILLPTYFAQARIFPMTLQEILLRGSAYKVDLLLLEKYYHARRSLPAMPEVGSFEGGYTRSFKTGIFHHVLHFDVASLYPSLLIIMERNPCNDSLGIFVPLLKELREYRLKYKVLAREAESEELRKEYSARQNSFKILINSFYGYLGFGNARFADSELAAEVTRRGREILQSLIDEFGKLGCGVLEADTDGIYLTSEEYHNHPDRLLEKVYPILPEGLELEYDGRYEAIFCYKSKNYALYDGTKVTIRGSALRSRGIEPYLKLLTDQLIRYLLGVEKESPLIRAEGLRGEIESSQIDISLIAKSEYLSQQPEAYKKAVTQSKKPRRASLEVALQTEPIPKMGERVTYYILPKEKGKTSDWQRARNIADFDPRQFPFDPSYYTKKIDAWIKRYSEFLETEQGDDAGKSNEQISLLPIDE